MTYCLVQDGAIVDGPRSLPASTETASNLSLLSQEQLQSLGWLPYREEGVAGPNQAFTGSSMAVFETEVVRTLNFRDLTQEEIDAANTQAVTDEWRDMRDERNYKLEKSDWTQLADSPLTDAEKLNWRTYRQALRDITTQTDPDNITWPQEPSQGIGVAIL
jgi:hypothetical protein